MESSPDLPTVLAQWTFHPFWVLVLVAAAAVYWAAFRRAAARGFPHPRWRLVSFMLSLVLVLLAVCSPIDHYGRSVLFVDFTGFLLLTMVAPPVMLLGAPLTLGFRATGKTGSRRLRNLYRCRLVAAITFPVVTWLVFAVATYVWQFTDLTELAVRHQPVRYVEQATMLGVGLLFWNPAIVADPLRWRLPYPLRSLYVFVEMTHKGLFGGMFLSMTSAVHGDLSANAPAWAPAPLTDQRLGILILWIGGNVIFLAALIMLIAGWMQYEKRHQERVDRKLRLEAEAKARRRAALDQVFRKGV
ncbi:MAG: cytochrome c oxidase assembly protein [Dehalococcoidia bacterium]|nr:cytochrome c oxidase assembly protein [Dehalococcoidia bacterium]